MSSKAHQALTGILTGGIAAGIFDIVYAFSLAGFREGTPLRILQSIASGVLGSAAFQEGAGAGLLGFALHLGITIAAATIYFLIARQFSFFRAHYILSGLVFGAGVYLGMNFVVLPLSAISFVVRYTPLDILRGCVSHALLVGIPIAWCLRRFTFGRSQKTMIEHTD